MLLEPHVSDGSYNGIRLERGEQIAQVVHTTLLKKGC